jgi:hypothetical protein
LPIGGPRGDNLIDARPVGVAAAVNVETALADAVANQPVVLSETFPNGLRLAVESPALGGPDHGGEPSRVDGIKGFPIGGSVDGQLAVPPAPGFTLRTYTHLMPDSADRARKAMEAFFADESPSALIVPSGGAR